jgi:hypothetical protein
LNALSEPLNGWPETGGQSGGWHLAFLVSRVDGIYWQDYLRISWTTQSQVSPSHARSSATRICRLALSRLAKMLNFGIGREKPFWGTLSLAVDSRSRVVGVRDGVRPYLFCHSSLRVSNLPVFGSLIDC